MHLSDVWDPHQVGDIMKLEKVQRRAARWVLNDYSRFTLMLGQLSWPSLQTRRKLSRLQTLHKMFHQQLALVLQSLRTTYQQHDQRDSTIHYTISYLTHLRTKIVTSQER